MISDSRKWQDRPIGRPRSYNGRARRFLKNILEKFSGRMRLFQALALPESKYMFGILFCKL